MKQDEDSTSGRVVNGFEGLKRKFTSLETIATREHNVLTRAQRYGRWMVLKSLSADVADKLVYQQMLRKELEILMQLQHPGVVQAMGIEEVPTLGMCIVMEWVDGTTLTPWLERNPSPAQRLRVLQQLMDALEYVHSCNIVHRDIKPSNIMVTHNGNNVKLIDFGLADTDTHATLKQPAGTIAYMAPEQAASSTPDIRNDIYSLGLVMRQLLPGGKYDRVVQRCLAPIGSRYASIDEMRRDMASVDNRRRRLWVTLASLVAIMLIAVVGMQQVAMHRMGERNNNVNDSLRHVIAESAQATTRQLDEQKNATGAMIGAMADTMTSLRRANDELVQRERDRLARQRAIDDAISGGIARARAYCNKSHLMEHLDTLSASKYMWPEVGYLLKECRRTTSHYLDSLKPQFTTKEMAEIEYAINEYCNDIERQALNKIEPMLMDD